MSAPVLHPGQLLLPAQSLNPTQWACVACDQFTSQPAYWAEARMSAGGQPSAVNLILPECDLKEADQRIPQIHAAMQQYLRDGVLTPGVENGFILTERTTQSGTRLGLVALLDLECYDYHPGNNAPVRASEETVVSRLPARVNIRRGAALEMSHVLMLIDDPMHSVVEPLHDRRGELEKLYDFPLMMNGGHLRGYAITAPEDIQFVYDALEKVNTYGTLRYAVGDGNHSLASAKAYWEEIKPTLTYEQTASHPARFAVVEVENIHDDALVFHPIHRVLFGVDGDELLSDFQQYAAERGMSLCGGDQRTVCVYEGKQIALMISGSKHALPVGTLQLFLDHWLESHPDVTIDYVHGSETAHALAAEKNVVAFLLPVPDGSALFATVNEKGVLPRKTFSMGSANEKRYYMEARRL